MDSKPLEQRISELADQDPADVVEEAEALADELEASLVAPDEAEGEHAESPEA